MIHAIQLCALFRKASVPAAYIVSDVKDSISGVRISREDNERNLEAYRNGALKVLVNVNILTEGVDLPKTKSVFLARPTVSSIMMTQMVGRALHGQSAGGTDVAYIVSFIDHWNEHISWMNPESLFEGSNDFTASDTERAKHELRTIALSKIEEFASMLDDAIDTTALEKVPFAQRIPIGMYAFTYLEEGGMDCAYQVMVYDSTAAAYRQLMEALLTLFKSYEVDTEYLVDSVLGEMENQCCNSFFCGEMIPPYAAKDIVSILKYYAQYDAAPPFYTFDAIDKSKLDVGEIARQIWNDETMSRRQQTVYLNSLWDAGDDSMLRLFFGRKLYFLRQVDVELMKLADPHIYDEPKNVEFGTKHFEDLPLHELGRYDPALEKQLRDGAFEASMNAKGHYCCHICGYEDSSRVLFQVDHIVPMNRGGKKVPENLQILCRSCNGRKGDRS